MSGERTWPDRDEDDPIIEAVGTAIADWWCGDFYESAKAALSTPVVTAAFAAAARLRSLAAIYEQPLNRDATFTFTGRELAAMLKEEG